VVARTVVDWHRLRPVAPCKCGEEVVEFPLERLESCVSCPWSSSATPAVWQAQVPLPARMPGLTEKASIVKVRAT
jgi:hypothetical protein